MGIEPTVDGSRPPLDLKSKRRTSYLATPIPSKTLLYGLPLTNCNTTKS